MGQMRIWVTGCGGFLGSRLVKVFTALGHAVIGLSRRKCQFNSRTVCLDLAGEKAFKQLHDLVKDVGLPDVIVHAASLKPGPYALSDYVKSNVLTTANLLDMVNQFPPRQFIYTSTLSVYGRPERNPVKEADPINGNFPYAITKWWAEQLLEPFQRQCQIMILRLPSLYGAGQDDSFIDGLARLAMRNEAIELYDKGEVVRDALHVEDIVGAIVSCATSPPCGQFLRFNLGCGKPVTARRYVEELLTVFKSSSRVLPVNKPSPQPFDLYGDIQEAQKQIGFKPTPLPASMERYASELRARQ